MDVEDRPAVCFIGPVMFEIEYNGTKLKALSRLDDRDRFGVTQMDQLTIIVDPDRPEDAIRLTVLHELLHAMWWVYSIPILKELDEADNEENIVGSLSSALLEIFRRNPDVNKWLRGPR